MPESSLTPERRRVRDVPDGEPPRAAFIELGLASCFSFLRGASDAVDLACQARALGYDAIGIADANTMAGVVRLHSEAKARKLTPVIGCRIETVEGLTFLAYPQDRKAYGRLCRLISAGRMGKLDGEWQDKGACDISLGMLAEHSEGVHLVLVPPDDLDAELTIAVESNVVSLGPPVPSEAILVAPFPDLLPHLTRQFPTLRHLAAAYLYRGDDLTRIARLDSLARQHALEILATNLPLYHAPHRRPLHDVMTAIRHKTTVAAAGHLLEANAERHLKGPEEMARLFADWPHALDNARNLADSCHFSLEELRYEYPLQTYPDGLDAQAYLDRLTWQGAAQHYPHGVPEEVAETLRKELALIGKKQLAQYFLTIKEVVDFARSREPPILCQGRGSAANSALCYALGITWVNPVEHALVFDGSSPKTATSRPISMSISSMNAVRR